MRLTAGEFSFYLFCIGMSFVNFQATLLIFIIPFLFARIVMMLGNWTQHAFVNLDDLEDNTINCINTKNNIHMFFTVFYLEYSTLKALS